MYSIQHESDWSVDWSMQQQLLNWNALKLVGGYTVATGAMAFVFAHKL